MGREKGMAKPGLRIYTRIRRADKRLVAMLAGLPVANIADNMGRISCVDAAIKPLNRVAMVGTAVTVKAPQGDNLLFHKALDLAEPGDIVCVDAQGGLTRSVCGEIMMRYAQSRGILGFVVDGCVRDRAGAEALDFGVYARGVQPNGPFKNGPGEINVPVSIGGQTVFPGDILCCDMDGVVVVRPADAEAVATLARKHSDLEEGKFREIAAGTLNKAWVDKELAALGCEIIDGYAE